MALTQVDQGLLSSTAQYTGFKNRILNGQMQIDQRNNGASVTPTAGTYTLDRWGAALSVASKFSIQRNAGAVTPPSGFTNYIGVTSLSAYTPVSGDYFSVYQVVEGFNSSDLNWGTANAQAVTLSFWLRSSLTGTFGGSISNGSYARTYPFSYTISAANTWEQKTITVPGDTTGTWATDNTAGLVLKVGLCAGSTYTGTANSWAAANYIYPTGSVNVLGTNGATFYITGVQLEKGSTATSFDYRPYGTELQLCQRYYQIIDFNGQIVNIYPGSNAAYTGSSLPVEMRAAPSPITYDTTLTNSGFVYYNGVSAACTYGNNASATARSISFYCSRTTGTWAATNELCGHTYVRIRAAAEL